MNNRLIQFDILKGLGILLVILCHAGFGGVGRIFIYTFHMPLFFFASGMFYKSRPFMDYLIKNIKQLIIPYLFFAVTIFIKNSYSISKSYIGDIHAFMMSISDCFDHIDIMNEADGYLFQSIWFLICLFIVRILYYVIDIIAKGNYGTMLIGSSVFYILGFLLQIYMINLPLFVDTAFSCVLFYNLGAIYYQKRLYEKEIPFWIPFISLFLCFMFCYKVKPIVEIKGNLYPIYLIFISIIPILSLSCISRKLADFKDRFIVHYFEKAGICSICILGFHNQLFYVIGSVFKLSKWPQELCSIKIILLVLFTTIIVFGLERLICRYAPFLLGRN